LCGGGRAVVVVIVGEGVREQRCWVMEWGGQKWAGVVVVVVGEGLGVGWFSEVREVGWGGVIIVIIIRGGG
jgi:hypothetical protein